MIRNMKTPRKKNTYPWENDITSWLKRHEIPEEKINLFIPYLWKKKQKWDLELMKEMVEKKQNFDIRKYLTS